MKSQMNLLKYLLIWALIAMAVGFAWYLIAAFSAYAQDTQVLVSNHGES